MRAVVQPWQAHHSTACMHAGRRSAKPGCFLGTYRPTTACDAMCLLETRAACEGINQESQEMQRDG